MLTAYSKGWDSTIAERRCRPRVDNDRAIREVYAPNKCGATQEDKVWMALLRCMHELRMIRDCNHFLPAWGKSGDDAVRWAEEALGGRKP